jgi:hypothetical protein
MNGSLLILGIELYNIKIQRAGQIMPEVRTELLPAADLERWTKPLRGRFNSQD